MSDTDEWSIDEWFVVALARTIRNGEAVFHGFASPCAQIAMHVARRTHARDVILIEGATYAVNPDPVFIPPTGNDLALHRHATYRMRFEEFFDAALRGDIDRMFVSGGQIDAYGNTNVTAIGPDPLHPAVKLGGGGGCNISATIKELTLWTTKHRSGRTLVSRLDFLTDVGHLTPSGSRKALGYTGGGPRWLITELGVFDFAPQGRARLRALWPDVTVADIHAATGFDVVSELSPCLLHPPSVAELAVLRSIDPLGSRRLEFDQRELGRRFRRTQQSACAC
jgi:glutaconate CoA-transferase, subunit B